MGLVNLAGLSKGVHSHVTAAGAPSTHPPPHLGRKYPSKALQGHAALPLLQRKKLHVKEDSKRQPNPPCCGRGGRERGKEAAGRAQGEAGSEEQSRPHSCSQPWAKQLCLAPAPTGAFGHAGRRQQHIACGCSSPTHSSPYLCLLFFVCLFGFG